MPALIPWQGPFHVALNAEESTVLLFWPFVSKLYKAVFGKNKKFLKKPRAEKIATVTTAAFGGWLIVREMILDQFATAKMSNMSCCFICWMKSAVFIFFFTQLFSVVVNLAYGCMHCLELPWFL